MSSQASRGLSARSSPEKTGLNEGQSQCCRRRGASVLRVLPWQFVVPIDCAYFHVNSMPKKCAKTFRGGLFLFVGSASLLRMKKSTCMVAGLTCPAGVFLLSTG